MQDDASDVQGVTFDLHVPVGVVATGVDYDQHGYLETLNIVACQKPDTYVGYKTVTAGARVAGTSNTTLKLPFNC